MQISEKFKKNITLLHFIFEDFDKNIKICLIKRFHFKFRLIKLKISILKFNYLGILTRYTLYLFLLKSQKKDAAPIVNALPKLP
ncbi:hypothetical protein A5893_12735 [Pedobacter psychrophilus]|uniref:Uncharacterized protein n=1 Tax=Pedobacter psychrophilus TaxID=1826909 RepID=A0A179DDX8_9SPHI|nr:hypothetical protein A5893_12735 [Pedobacter psychrophilus]